MWHLYIFSALEGHMSLFYGTAQGLKPLTMGADFPSRVWLESGGLLKTFNLLVFSELNK